MTSRKRLAPFIAERRRVRTRDAGIEILKQRAGYDLSDTADLIRSINRGEDGIVIIELNRGED
jgi:hypothetical protein